MCRMKKLIIIVLAISFQISFSQSKEKKYLKFDSFSNSTYEYDEKELVIPLINITRDTYEIYVKQYTAHFQPKDYFSIKIANDFYKTPYPNINYISEILKNLETSNYWTKNINTKLNITNKFINRGFNLTVSQRVTDLNIKVTKLTHKQEKKLETKKI